MDNESPGRRDSYGGLGDHDRLPKSDELSIQEHGDSSRPQALTAADLEKDETDVESARSVNSEPKGPEKDPHLVEWDGLDDPQNPINWPVWKKWAVTMSLAWMSLWVTFASSVFSSATMATAAKFHVSTEVMTLGTSVLLFGYMLGPLIWGPLSELYGRRIPLFTGYIVFIIFQIPVAVAQNVETIMLCRFIQGTFGCSPLVVCGGALADFWDPVNRAVAVAMFASATFLGPTLGPIVYVFISSFCSWI